MPVVSKCYSWRCCLRASRNRRSDVRLLVDIFKDAKQAFWVVFSFPLVPLVAAPGSLVLKFQMLWSTFGFWILGIEQSWLVVHYVVPFCCQTFLPCRSTHWFGGFYTLGDCVIVKSCFSRWFKEIVRSGHSTHSPCNYRYLSWNSFQLYFTLLSILIHNRGFAVIFFLTQASVCSYSMQWNYAVIVVARKIVR